MNTMNSINPATGKVFAKTRELTNAELEKKLARAGAQFAKWREKSYAERAVLMKKLAKYLRANKASIAKIMTAEMGKIVKASVAEVEKCALVADYYAENAERILSPEIIPSDASESFVRFDPLGVVLAVMPWNFPLWQVFRFAAPALMAGNVGILKHASNVQKCAETIEKAFTAVGFPPGAFQNLAISSGRVERVIRDPRVVAVTLTGSEGAGSKVARVAGEELKKTVLELGGSDPFIVLKDADINAACASALTARMQGNVGQSCISAKRFIIDSRTAKKFLAGISQGVARLKVGDPTDESTDVGPMASEQMAETIDKQVKDSIKLGAKLIFGGARISGEGFFYQPTILADVHKGMPAYDEELFGPVFAVMTFKSEEEAIRIGNDTIYGLGATIFTKNTEKAKKLARRIEAGAVFINNQVKSDPRLPFGGIKKSGYGRELSTYGIKEFVNIKTVWIK